MRRYGWLAVLAGLALVVLLLVQAGRATPAAQAAAPATAAVEGATAERSPAATATDVTAAAPSHPAAPDDDARLTQRNERVSQAIALLRYPPSSQPLTSAMRDVLQPNRRHETPMPLAFATGGSGNGNHAPGRSDLSYELTGDVYTVIGGGSLHPTLRVFREATGGDATPVGVDVTDTTLSLVESSGLRAVSASLVFQDDGHGSYAATLTPADVPELASYRGLARLDVGFVAREGDHRPARASLDFRVASSVPATFVGVTGERLTPDGLELTVTMDVREPGRYFVQGLLFDGKDQPIGFAVARPQLGAGSAAVPLVFFGLLFHDANASGPYVFRTLTGARLPDGQEPDRAELAAWSGPYRTSAYALADFSPQEYEAPAKDAKIQALSALANAKAGR